MTPADIVAMNLAGKIHNHITSLIHHNRIPNFENLDDGKLGGGNVEGVDICGQAGKGLLGSIRPEQC